MQQKMQRKLCQEEETNHKQKPLINILKAGYCCFIFFSCPFKYALPFCLLLVAYFFLFIYEREKLSIFVIIFTMDKQKKKKKKDKNF